MLEEMCEIIRVFFSVEKKTSRKIKHVSIRETREFQLKNREKGHSKELSWGANATELYINRTNKMACLALTSS